MRANGTRTPKELSRELTRIGLKIIAIRRALDVFRDSEETYGMGPVSDATSEAWNAMHDAVTALEAERRDVELNRAYADATALLVAQNID